MESSPEWYKDKKMEEQKDQCSVYVKVWPFTSTIRIICVNDRKDDLIR